MKLGKQKIEYAYHEDRVNVVSMEYSKYEFFGAFFL